MNADELKRLFPNASASTILRNSGSSTCNIKPNCDSANSANSAWSPTEIAWLVKNYPYVGLANSATHLNRSLPFIRMEASRLGLRLDLNSAFYKDFQKRAAKSKIGKKLSPDHIQKAVEGRKRNAPNRPPQICSEMTRRKLAEVNKQRYSNPEYKKRWMESLINSQSDPGLNYKRGVYFRRIWADPNSVVNSDEYRQLLSDRMMKMMSKMPASNAFSRTKKGKREDLDISFRSSWEANYARYLNFLIKHEGKICKWEYESETFWFESIKRGVRSWKPDFKVYMVDGAIEYHEVKGWMYPRAKTALNRMRIYHPEVKVVLIDEKRYKNIDHQFKRIIPNWEVKRHHHY